MSIPSNAYGFAQVPALREDLEFLVVCRNSPVFQTVAAAIHEIKGRLHCVPGAATARDYAAWRKLDGIVIDMNLPGSLDLLRRLRSRSSNRSSAVFACAGSSSESQQAIGAGANFVLHQPLLPGKMALALTAAADIMMAEKRRHHRFPLMIPVGLKMKEREVESTMSNLSEAGMAIWSLYYRAPGSLIQFAFELPTGSIIRGEGEVAWTNADGLAGIQFRDLPAPSNIHLADWICRNSEI
jgi:CheY-like chemotaxis protein